MSFGRASLAAYACQKALERFEHAVDAKVRGEIGREINSSCHWFSEDKSVYLALRILGDNVRDGYRVDPSSWRNEWRRQTDAISESEK